MKNLLWTLTLLTAAACTQKPTSQIQPSSPGTPDDQTPAADVTPVNPAFTYTGSSRDANLAEVESNGQGGYRFGTARMLRARFVDLVQDGVYETAAQAWTERLGSDVAATEMSRKVRDRFVYIYANLTHTVANGAFDLRINSTGDNLGVDATYTLHGNANTAGDATIRQENVTGNPQGTARVDHATDKHGATRLLIDEEFIAQTLWKEPRRSVLGLVLRSTPAAVTIDECADGANGAKSAKLNALYDLFRNLGPQEAKLETWALIGGGSKLVLTFRNVTIYGSLTDRPLWPIHFVVNEDGATRSLEHGPAFANDDAKYTQTNMFRLSLSPVQGQLQIRMDLPGCSEPAIIHVTPKLN